MVSIFGDVERLSDFQLLCGHRVYSAPKIDLTGICQPTVYTMWDP
jgi:hypothetical protein